VVFLSLYRSFLYINRFPYTYTCFFIQLLQKVRKKREKKKEKEKTTGAYRVEVWG
jgi:hypothetical protein